MSVSISIVPFSESLDVYGEPDRHAAYSLSGYVEVSLSSSLYASYFDRRRIVSILLQSLVVTFEGQTELLTEETGYSALRLCSISQQLVTDEPIELSNIEHDREDGACTWNVVFNLTVPGWLPETSKFGQREGGTRYALHASAVLNNGDSSGSSSWFSTFCSPFRSQTRIVKAPHVDIQLNRLRSPAQSLSESTSLWPHTHYAVTPDVEPKKDNTFPVDLLSSLRVQMSAPEFVGMEDESIPFSLRLRAVGLSESECSRLRVSDFDVELEQSERYRMLPLDAYIQQYPVPPRSQQPPRVPLLDPHPVQAIYELGLASPRPIAQNVTRSFSLLPENTSGHYVIGGDGYAFRGDANTSRSDSWFSLQTSVGVAHRTQSSKEDDDSWKSRRTLRPSSQSPFLGVVHKLHVTLTCTYDLTEGENPERVTQRIRFFVPLRFTRTLSQPHCSSVAGDNNSPDDHSTSPAMRLLDLPKPSSLYATSLPAYSQLFYANGDRKIDYSIPLPVYTPDPSASDLVLGKYPEASEPEETHETAPLLQ